MTDVLYGKNAILESLRANRRRHKRLMIATGASKSKTLESILITAKKSDIPIEYVNRHLLDTRTKGASHQGVVLETSEYPYIDIDDCLELAQQRQEEAFLLLLDHIQDPQNVGSLLRTAEIVGIHGIVLPGRRTATITPSVVNASSGASEHLNIVTDVNLAQTMKHLSQSDVWVVGVEDDERANDFDQVNLNMPIALVVGSEGSGLARLTRERCDFMVRLPMRGHISSLNVAVAGSIVLYHTWRQRSQNTGDTA